MHAPDLVGQVFAGLTVESPIGSDKFRRMMWNCRCTCGNNTAASTQDLRSGKTKTCGKCRRRGAQPRILLTNDGKTMSVRQWASELGIPSRRIYARIRRGVPEHAILNARFYERVNKGTVRSRRTT